MAARCRQMLSTDIPAAAVLLWRGLKGRSLEFWLVGLERLHLLASRSDAPCIGYVLEKEGALVGAVLTIYAEVDGVVRCNLSSWYVIPEFRSLGVLMARMAFRRAGVTYINISPNPGTWKTIEAQGFASYVTGQHLTVPSLSRPRRCRIRVANEADDKLLIDHAAMGCLSLIVEEKGIGHPFIFMVDRWNIARFSIKIVQMIYCRDIDSFVKFSGKIGRYLLRHGVVLVAYDSNGKDKRLFGRYTSSSGPRYFRGMAPPRLGDLAFCEWVVFGPGLRGETRSSSRFFRRAHQSV